MRRTVRDHLTTLGHPVLEAADGQEAADLLTSVSDIGLIVSDITMAGGIDGHRLAELARERRPDIRVLLMSGYATAGESAAFPVLAKPFTRRDLERALALARAG